MGMCNHIASWSIDESRKIGAVIVDDRNDVISMGWNGPPRGIDDTQERIHIRPEKYKWYEHAERNALYNAAANGRKLVGCKIYQNMYPCADCARGIVQSGIVKVITVEPNWDDATYRDDFAVTRLMLEQAGVSVQFIEGEHLERKDD
jgi:dCMP deaminase